VYKAVIKLTKKEQLLKYRKYLRDLLFLSLFEKKKVHCSLFCVLVGNIDNNLSINFVQEGAARSLPWSALSMRARSLGERGVRFTVVVTADTGNHDEARP